MCSQGSAEVKLYSVCRLRFIPVASPVLTLYLEIRCKQLIGKTKAPLLKITGLDDLEDFSYPGFMV